MFKYKPHNIGILALVSKNKLKLKSTGNYKRGIAKC